MRASFHRCAWLDVKEKYIDDEKMRAPKTGKEVEARLIEVMTKCGEFDDNADAWREWGARMIRPAVFLTAAVWLDELRAIRSHGCCAALTMAGANEAEEEMYCDYFGCTGSYLSRRVQWGDHGNHSPEQHEARVWAMLFLWAAALDLEADIVREIRQRKESYSKMSKRFGINVSCISKIINRKHWSHVE